MVGVKDQDLLTDAGGRRGRHGMGRKCCT
jgi:hypothetical protein